MGVECLFRQITAPPTTVGKKFSLHLFLLQALTYTVHSAATIKIIMRWITLRVWLIFLLIESTFICSFEKFLSFLKYGEKEERNLFSHRRYRCVCCYRSAWCSQRDGSPLFSVNCLPSRLLHALCGPLKSYQIRGWNRDSSAVQAGDESSRTTLWFPLTIVVWYLD